MYFLVRKRDNTHEVRESSGSYADDKRACMDEPVTWVSGCADQAQLEALKARLDGVLGG